MLSWTYIFQILLVTGVSAWLNEIKPRTASLSKLQRLHQCSPSVEDESNASGDVPEKSASYYDLGIGKNLPLNDDDDSNIAKPEEIHWNVPSPVEKYDELAGQEMRSMPTPTSSGTIRRVRKMVAKTQEDATLRGAIWHEEHFVDEGNESSDMAVGGLASTSTLGISIPNDYETFAPPEPTLLYPDIDLSIPDDIYCEGTDAVWELMRWEAFMEAKREPLLVSFLYSSILNHDCLESSLAFLLANKLSSPAMISTQIQSLILEALETDPSIGRKIRADIMAVRDRDPACTCLPDVYLYFKGFHALQTYRVANVLWNAGKRVLSHYLQSQMSQTFQIDIHPNATLGSGIMLDHGTGIVVGETARIGNNCSILHHVTLGGSGKRGVDRHPKVGDGVLLGAGASILGNIQIGDGTQVGAGTLVITDLPPHVVAVGVPAKIIGSFIDVTEQPSIEMNQMMDKRIIGFQSDGI